jgi:hypothetical protein
VEVAPRCGWPLVDAWRFDEGGCQGSGRITYSFAAFEPGCPAFEGSASWSITNYELDFGGPRVVIRIAHVFEPFPAAASTRYTLWMISFDHTHSVLGATVPGESCGGISGDDAGFIADTMFLHSDTNTTSLAGGGERGANWDYESCSVPTKETSWGRVKATYR